jgi:hypothetical protein
MLHRAQIDINTLYPLHQEPTVVLDHLLPQVADLEPLVIWDIHQTAAQVLQAEVAVVHLHIQMEIQVEMEQERLDRDLQAVVVAVNTMAAVAAALVALVVEVAVVQMVVPALFVLY